MWARLANTALGIWLMAAPAVLGYGDPAQTNDQIAGPIAATFAIIAIWETTRALRWCNLLVGLWLLLAPWILGGYPGEAMMNSLAVGVLMIALALVRGKIEKTYGGGWRGYGVSGEEDAPSGG